MKINNFKEMYLAELSELADAETRLAVLQARLAEKADDRALHGILIRHRDETQAQAGRLRAILGGHNVNPDMHKDQAMAHLIEEAEKMADILTPPSLRDAGIIASMQRLEHYEIAAYGTVAAYAGALGLADEQAELHRMVEEAKDADAKLTILAEQYVNPHAAAAAA